MLVVGLTGDVGAGKSTLSSIWRASGAHVIDADAIVSDIWKDEEMIALAVDRWGIRIISGSGKPDHAVISGIVFENDEEYRWVCNKIHPIVRKRMAEMARCLEGWVVAEIPLLFENGVADWIDLTVYVEAPLETRLSRNSHRGWGLEEIRKREGRLMERTRKMELADFIVTNDGSLEKLRLHAKTLASRFLAASSLMKISVPASSGEEARLASERLEDCPIAAEVSTSSGNHTVSAFIIEESIEEILLLLEDIKLRDGFPIDARKIVKAPRDVLFWAMRSAEN